jgi:hypothetical protein
MPATASYHAKQMRRLVMQKRILGGVLIAVGIATVLASTVLIHNDDMVLSPDTWHLGLEFVGSIIAIAGIGIGII